MRSHPLHAWHHRHLIWHHIHSWWQHTIVCMSWHTLCLWHHMQYVCCHPYCGYHYPSFISDLKPVKSAISSTLYVITPSLLRTSYVLCNHHRSHMYAIICVVHVIISTLYDHNPKYLWNQMHYIHYLTCIIYDISTTLYDVTFPMCVTSHNGSIYDIKHYVYDIFTWYGITHSVMTTRPLCAFTAIMPDITLSVLLTWHTMYQFYEKKWMCVITTSICMTPYALHMTSNALFMTSHHFIYDIKSTISNITSIISDLTDTVSV